MCTNLIFQNCVNTSTNPRNNRIGLRCGLFKENSINQEILAHVKKKNKYVPENNLISNITKDNGQINIDAQYYILPNLIPYVVQHMDCNLEYVINLLRYYGYKKFVLLVYVCRGLTRVISNEFVHVNETNSKLKPLNLNQMDKDTSAVDSKVAATVAAKVISPKVKSLPSKTKSYSYFKSEINKKNNNNNYMYKDKYLKYKQKYLSNKSKQYRIN